MASNSRKANRASNRVTEKVVGTKSVAYTENNPAGTRINSYELTDKGRPKLLYRAKRSPNPYVAEHINLMRRETDFLGSLTQRRCHIAFACIAKPPARKADLPRMVGEVSSALR